MIIIAVIIAVAPSVLGLIRGSKKLLMGEAQGSTKLSGHCEQRGASWSHIAVMNCRPQALKSLFFINLHRNRAGSAAQRPSLGVKR